MDDATVSTLALTALFFGTVHTVLGPDHYLPFLALARARRWALPRTLAVTVACGVAHVLSSVLLGVVGVAAGLAVGTVVGIEEARAPLATWALLGFGLAYGAWGLLHAYRNRPHRHAHVHADGTVHDHDHAHHRAHAHGHGDRGTFWVLFLVFVLGPCEPLIPLLMYPAAAHDWGALAWVTGVFAVSTIATMTAVTAAGWYGLSLVRLGAAERWTHALAGGALAASGALVLFLGV